MTYTTRREFLSALALASIPGILPEMTRAIALRLDPRECKKP